MFWRGVIGYLPANLIQAIVGFLTIVMFTRILTPEQYGNYAIGYTIMALAHTGLFTWNEAAMARFWAEESLTGTPRDHLATIYRIWTVLLISLPVAALLLFMVPLRPGVLWAALAGFLALLPRTLLKLVQERQRAAGEVGSAAGLDMGVTTLGFIFGVILAWAGLGGAGVLLGAGAGAAILLVFALPSEMSRSRQGRFEAPRARHYFAYGAPVALSLILALVLSSTDRLLIGLFLGDAQVGVYHAGYSLANRTLDVLFIWLGYAGGPALIMALENGGVSALRKAAQEQFDVMVLITAPASVGLAMVSAPLAELLVGPELRGGAAQITPWIAASAFLSGMSTYYFAHAFTLAKRTRLLLVAMSVPAIANVILNLVLLPRMGLQGALLATVLSYALGMVVYVSLGRRVLAMPIDWGALVQTGLACLVMALVLNQIPPVGGVIELALKTVSGLVVYGGLVYAFNVGGIRGRAGEVIQKARARFAT